MTAPSAAVHRTVARALLSLSASSGPGFAPESGALRAREVASLGLGSPGPFGEISLLFALARSGSLSRVISPRGHCDAGPKSRLETRRRPQASQSGCAGISRLGVQRFGRAAVQPRRHRHLFPIAPRLLLTLALSLARTNHVTVSFPDNRARC